MGSFSKGKVKSIAWERDNVTPNPVAIKSIS